MMLHYFSHTFHAMGSSCEICLYAKNKTQAEHIGKISIQFIQKLEQRYSRYIRNNWLYEINQAAQKGTNISVDDETAALLNYADTCYQNSDGLFDISSGILRQAWNFKSKQLPANAKIKNLLKHIGWDKITWKQPVLSFGCTGMELDFGGIVKEYAADKIAVICQNYGVFHGLINLGGDIRVIGAHPGGKAWSIGIRHPRKQRKTAAVLHLKQGGISSSGDYERCIKIGGTYYSHILNPKTGYPVNGLASVTVKADFCLVAGSASTIAMLYQKKGKDWLQENDFQAVWVDVDGNLGNTEKIKPSLAPF